MLFSEGETFENYSSILLQYKQALETRTNIINKLYAELKDIKKLKV